MPTVVVVGLGPADVELVTVQARRLIEESEHVWIRTRRHPAASLAPNAPTFDDIYDHADKIQDVYPTIVEKLVGFAAKFERIVYAVPGSPSVAESTVELLLADKRVDVEVLPAVSFLDLVWSRLGIDPLALTPRIVDGQRFALDAAGETNAMVVAQCDSALVLSNIKLAYEDENPGAVTVLQRLGLPDENIETIAWHELDRIKNPDHLTTLWIANGVTSVAHDLERLHTVARELRELCPWDQEQTHESLKRYAIEETYELVEAIDERAADVDSTDEHLIEELGDVLFQVYAHAAIAEEDGRFNITDVARNVTEKLVQRHPHVYGDVVAETAADVKATWEANKMVEKSRTSVMDGIPRQLPALMLATKTLKRAAGSPVEFAVDDLTATGVGKALLVMVDEARKRSEDPEEALRQVVAAYTEAFKAREGM